MITLIQTLGTPEVPLRQFLDGSSFGPILMPKALVESSDNSLSLDSYSLGRAMSHL